MYEQLVQSTSPKLRLPGTGLREDSCQWPNVAQHDVKESERGLTKSMYHK
jgi:hypothetical protein